MQRRICLVFLVNSAISIKPTVHHCCPLRLRGQNRCCRRVTLSRADAIIATAADVIMWKCIHWLRRSALLDNVFEHGRLLEFRCSFRLRGMPFRTYGRTTFDAIFAIRFSRGRKVQVEYPITILVHFI